ncbi:MAG: hypothetical protein ABL927_01500 [Bdellovibrionales bacterium]
MKKQIINQLSNERGSAMLVMMLFMSMALSVMVTNSMSSFSDVSKEASSDTASKAAQFLASNIVKYVENERAFYGGVGPAATARNSVVVQLSPIVPTPTTPGGIVTNRPNCVANRCSITSSSTTTQSTNPGGQPINNPNATTAPDALTCLNPANNGMPSRCKADSTYHPTPNQIYDPTINNALGLFNTNAQLIFDPTITTNGFDMNLQPCNAFNADLGNDACPYRPTIYWVQPTDIAKCGGNCDSKIEIRVDIVYRPLNWATKMALATNSGKGIANQNKQVSDTMNSYLTIRPINL